MFQTPSRLFRVFAVAEAITWTLLIAGLILRQAAGLSVAVLVGGGIHGFVFLCYGATVILVAKNNRWRPLPVVLALASAIVPYATVPAEIWLHRTGRLAGSWRLHATDDPRDATWHDRLLRFFLGRPVLLGGIAVVAVAALFTVLLVIGPPGGRA
ncbi:DUF3817 domain-containing protein [Microbacterium luticocti]|uniref:DUF3817 domain-containing protein n=1 Tax=Microbacterium luticocti TaxID=451764 RepID=UPI00048FD0AA|nr:DUF3817 domain-containing protein [Microbacterium luticocti]